MNHSARGVSVDERHNNEAIAAVAAVAAEFLNGTPPDEIQPFAGGHIHDSYLVAGRLSDGTPARLLLQQINEFVFPNIPALERNITRVTGHIRRRLQADGVHDGKRRTLTVIPTRTGAAILRDGGNKPWRAFEFIESTVTRQTVETPADAETAALAFGRFARLLADFPAPRLDETIPGFHDTPRRLAHFEDAVHRDAAGRAASAAAEIALVRAHAEVATLLLDPLARREMPERVVHNDAKLSNVLLDAATGEALCVVDLDTVMPGATLFDFGDMVRSMTCRAAEDAEDLAGVRADPAMFEALVRGYARGTGNLLTSAERGLLVEAGMVITYEQGVRFLADDLAGDRYYRTTRPRQNLARARVQFALLRSLIEQRSDLAALAERELSRAFS